MYSLHNLDTLMLDYINYENGFFIECGANDGISQSNTLLYERHKKWKGLLVEPNRAKYEECVRNRPNSIVEHGALISDTYGGTHIHGNFAEDSYGESLMAMVVDSGDWQSTQISKHQEEKRATKTIVAVPAFTLTSLLCKHNIQAIDFFSLDVEGYEVSVLNGLDFSVYRPKYILIETANYPDAQEKVRGYMEERNYSFVKPLSANDDLFVDKK